MSDLISRDALKSAMCEGCDGEACNRTTFDCYSMRAIIEAPTIDAEPVRHGHWKDKRRYEIGPSVDDDGWVELQELCSACNMWVITDWRSPEYCSKCGAQMRRVSE